MQSVNKIGPACLLAVAYFVAAYAGLKVASIHPNATAVWPATGIAFAALFLAGSRIWPGVWLGALAVNLAVAPGLSMASVLSSAGIATGNTLEAVVGVLLVRRYAGGASVFDRPETLFKFVFLGALTSTLLSPTIGVLSLCVVGLASWANFGPIWLTWWLGDATGELLVAPLLILWASRPAIRWNGRKAMEGLILLALVVLVGMGVFGQFVLGSIKNPLAFLCLPPLIWVASRFRPREAATAVAVLAVIAIIGTLRGLGPFVRTNPNESLLLLQSFLGINAVMALALSANVSDRQQAAEALARSEARFRQIAETIAEVFYLYDVVTNKLVYISPAYETVWGRTCEALYQNPQSFIEPILPEHRERVLKALERQRAGELTEEEYAIVRPTGTVRWIRDRGYPLRDADGRVCRITGIATDITERKAIQDALQRANQQVTSILNNITNSFATLDNQWRLTYLNPHAARLLTRLQKSQKELMGQSIWDALPDLANSTLGAELRAAASQQTPVSCEYFSRKLNGWFDVQAYPSPEGLAVYFNEVTERKQAEVARGRFASIVESSTDAIITTDLAGNVTTWNPAAERLFGYLTNEIVGQPVASLVPRDVAEEDAETMGRIQREERVEHFETVRLRKDLRRINVSVAVSPIKDGNGRIIGASTIARDITERKRAETMIQSALEEKEVMLKEINHRVKNNLQVISSFLFLQAERVKDPATRELFTETQNRVSTMANIHENLYHSKNLSRIDFGEFTKKLASDLFRSYGAKPEIVTLRVNVPQIHLSVDTAIPCALIINELISNVFKYAFPGGRTGEIDIDLAEGSDRKVTLVVRDNGVGMAKDLDIRRTKSLGMQIVTGLTKQLRGTIELQNHAGTEFKITFIRPAEPLAVR